MATPKLVSAMSDAFDLGKMGEQLATEHLKKNGYSILARNYKITAIAEVDIVASKDEHIIFVEVKTRESDYLNDPALMVPMKKQRQIIKAADEYVKEHEVDLPWRFDIISIVLNKQYKKIDHIEDAFYPTI
jgi:putative endonuclease